MKFGSTWTAEVHTSSSNDVRQILDSGSSNHVLILDCEILDVVKMENSKSTWVVKLVDPGTGESEPRSLEWLLHQKYVPLMANPSDTIGRSTSRGLMHALAQSRSIQGYNGGRFFVPNRLLKICSPRVHQQWTLTGPVSRLLPNETAIVILEKKSETDVWQELNAQVVAESAKTNHSRISFKAVVLSIPTAIFDHGNPSDYIQPSSEDNTHLDIVLGDSSLKPIGMLRLAPANRLIVPCLHEGDIICIHNALIISQSQEFVSKRSGLLSSETSDTPSLHLNLPLVTYASDSIFMLLTRKTIEKEEKCHQTPDSLNQSLLSTPLDYRFHGPKFTPILLKPSCNNITIAGYIIAVFPRQTPKNGYRRYGFRLQGTQTSDTCDVTVWEDLVEPISMVSTLKPGHLVLLQGLFTVDKGDDIVLANIAKDGGTITNLSITEGIAASHPDLASPHDIQELAIAPPDLPSLPPRNNYGPFILFDCNITPAKMSLSTSLHHTVCRRSVGQPNLVDPLNTQGSSQTFCKFCNHLINNWRLECTWEFDVEWNVLAHSKVTNKQLSIKVLASASVSLKILGTTAEEFVLMSEVQQEMIALNRASFPAIGRACISRQPNSTLHMDQFISAL